MSEHDDILRRLGALGRQPVDPDVASQHLSAMSTAPTGRTTFQRLRVVGAFALGLMMGTTGLATAGALPDPIQEVAHDTLGAVGVDVPRAKRYQGPECNGAENHGQYVRSQPKGNRSEAAKSPCGKPLPAVDGENGSPAGEGCGKPPWAGKGKPDPAEKAAAQAARKAACGARGDDDNDPGPSIQGAQPEPEEEPGEPTTSTTGTSSTSSTSSPSTSSSSTSPSSTSPSSTSSSSTSPSSTSPSSTSSSSTTSTTVDDSSTTTTTNSGPGS